MELDLGGTVYALGWSLVHFLWQGAVIALALELALLALRNSSSDARYAARCAALALMGIAPVVTFLALLPTQPAAAAPEPLAALAGVAAGDAWSGVAWLAVVVAAWSVGAGVLGARLLRDYLRVRRLQKRVAAELLPTFWQVRFEDLASAMGVRAVARLADSAVLAAPTVIGWVKPVVLIPARVLTGLSQEQVEALIAHELAHVRRHDFVVNLVQSALEALLFYHPAVWWVSRGIRAEREYCCDDMALRVTANELAYARALTTLEGWRGAEAQIGMSTLGGSLMHRIQRMLGIRSSGPRARGPLTALGVLLVASTLGATAFGYAAPEDPEDLLRDLRREIAELKVQVRELRDLLTDFHGHRDAGRVEARHRETRDHRHEHGHEHGHSGDHLDHHGDLEDLHDHVEEILEDAGVDWRHGDDGHVSVEVDGARLHDHLQRALKGLHGDDVSGEVHERVREALERAGVDWEQKGEGRFEIQVDGKRLHDHVRDVLREHRAHGAGSATLRRRAFDALHGVPDPGEIHRQVLKSLEEAGLHELDVELDELHGAHRVPLKGRLKIEGLGEIDLELDQLHDHLREMHVDLGGLHGELLEALESSGRDLRALELDGALKLDGDVRIEVKTKREGDPDGRTRTLKLRKHSGSPVLEVEIDGERVELDAGGLGLDGADVRLEVDGASAGPRVRLRRFERAGEDDLLREIRRAREEAEAKAKRRDNSI